MKIQNLNVRVLLLYSLRVFRRDGLSSSMYRASRSKGNKLVERGRSRGEREVDYKEKGAGNKGICIM